MRTMFRTSAPIAAPVAVISQNQQRQQSQGFLGGTNRAIQGQKQQFPVATDQQAEQIYPLIQAELEKFGFPVNSHVLIGRIPGGNTITLTDFGIKRNQPNAAGKKVKNVLNVTLGWLKTNQDGSADFQVPNRDTIVAQLEHSKRMIATHAALVKYMEAALQHSTSTQVNGGDPADC